MNNFGKDENFHHLLRWVVSLGDDTSAEFVVRNAYPSVFDDEDAKMEGTRALDQNKCSPWQQIENSEEQALLFVAHRLSDIHYLRIATDLDEDESRDGIGLLESCLDRVVDFDDLLLVRAIVHDSLGCVLHDCEPSRAAESFSKALEIWKCNGRSNDRFALRRCASSAYNLGIVSLELHRLSEADESLRFAFTIRYKHRNQWGSDSKGDLALVHDAIGQLRQDQLRLGDAERHHRRSIKLLRENAHVDSGRWLDTLAGALNNLGQALSLSMQPQAALIVQEEVLSVYQSLFELNPDYYATDIAMAWHNLGQTHADLRSLEIAEQWLQKALQLRSELIVNDPASIESVAQTLDSLGTVYTEHKQYDKAKPHLQKALKIRLDLCVTDAERHTYDLCRTMLNLGIIFHDLGSHDVAVTLFEDAERRYTSLDSLDGSTNAALATVRMNASAIYRELAQYDSALESSTFAVREFRQLVSGGAQEQQVSLATALNNLGLVEHAIRQVPAARDSFNESLSLTRALVLDNDQLHLPDLGRTLLNIASLYRSIDDLERAREAAVEAHQVYQELASDNPGSFDADLGNAAMNLGIITLELEDYLVSEQMFDQALSIHNQLALEDQSAYRPTLARVLLNLFSLYAEQDRTQAVEHTLSRSIVIYSVLVANGNSTYLDDFALIHANAGVWFERSGNNQRAFEHYAKAVELCEQAINTNYAYVSKGDVTVAYQRLLAKNTADDTTAFGYASALLDSGYLTGVGNAEELRALQEELADASARHSREHVMLVPISDISDERMTLGLITVTQVSWFSINCIGWEELAKPARNASDVRRLSRLGRTIWDCLPTPVQEVFKIELSDSSTILIGADARWSVFPWELIRHREEPDGFLGLDHVLARVETLSAKRLHSHLSCLSLGSCACSAAIFAAEQSGSKLLVAAKLEATAAKETLVGQGGEIVAFATGKTANIDYFCNALLADPDLVYFCGHGDVVETEELLILSGSSGEATSLFGAYNLEKLSAVKMQESLFSHSPLVVLSSCLVGNRRQFGGHREDLVGRFLHHGAGAVIATALPIDDHVAERFGRTLLSNKHGEESTISDRVIKARREIALDPALAPNSRIWGAWARIHVHGAPHAILFKKLSR